MKVSKEFNIATGVMLYRYENKRGIISLSPPTEITRSQWEIYCLEGDLFKDIESFTTKDAAERRIFEILGEECTGYSARR